MYNKEELYEIVNKAILNLDFDDETPGLTDPAKYILTSGGKRLRPVLALMAANIFTRKIEPVIIPAIGLEIFHNFTLVHDDIMDGAIVRRNNPTIHIKWNPNQAILSGDVMAFIANRCIAQSPADKLGEVLKIFNEVAIGVCKGQQLDMDFEKIRLVTEHDYMRMVELKTAILIAGALKIGAILGGAPQEEADKLYSFGLDIGLAFQIQDDFLDTFGDEKIFGKKIGGDIIANKKTILLVRALETASGEQLEELNKQLDSAPDNPSVKIEKVKQVYESTDVGQYATDLATGFAEKAFTTLETISTENENLIHLSDLANELLNRNR